MSAGLEFGQRVEFCFPLERKSEWVPDPRKMWGGYTRKYWDHSHYSRTAGDWRPGIIIGQRALQNGRRLENGPEEPLGFVAEETVHAYLVAHHMRRKPVLVRVEDVRPA